MLHRFFHSDAERRCYRGGKRDRENLASLPACFFSDSHADSTKDVTPPAKGPILSEAVALVTKQLYMKTSTEMQ